MDCTNEYTKNILENCLSLYEVKNANIFFTCNVNFNFWVLQQIKRNIDLGNICLYRKHSSNEWRQGLSICHIYLS